MTNGYPPEPTCDDAARAIMDVAIQELEEFIARYNKHRLLPEVEARFGPTLDAIAETLDRLKGDGEHA